jgi:hypothetical protein
MKKYKLNDIYVLFITILFFLPVIIVRQIAKPDYDLPFYYQYYTDNLDYYEPGFNFVLFLIKIIISNPAIGYSILPLIFTLFLSFYNKSNFFVSITIFFLVF